MNETMITVTGNVATPPELRTTPGGVPLARFRLASTERRWDRETSSWVDGHTSWFAVTLFRGLADHAFRSLEKGDRVILTGRMRVRAWDNGTKSGTDAEIEADAIGHDLRWGTSSFTRSSRASASPEAANEEWAPVATGEAADASAAAGTAEGPETTPERELVASVVPF